MVLSSSEELVGYDPLRWLVSREIPNPEIEHRLPLLRAMDFQKLGIRWLLASRA
jgi:hypothetical protein